jgi:hypothetical protein
MRLVRRLAPLAIVLLAACRADHDPPRTTTTKLQPLPFDRAALPELAHQGSVVDGLHWRDRDGEHHLLLAQTGATPSPEGACPPGECFDAEVYAYDYVRQGAGDYRLAWRTYDFQHACDLDLFAGFVPGSAALTDLDGDGVAESSFLYKTACRSDVSPATLKLILHEGGRKYAIRGTTDVTAMVGPEYGRGPTSIDPALQAIPAFRAFAASRWSRFAVEKEFEQMRAPVLGR